MAECMLRKKELLDVERRSELRTTERETERPGGDEQAPDEAALEAERIRSASLYHPSLAHEPMLIPRLLRTRKTRTLKEIQRHTTSEGLIKNFVDKQNLFIKWKKLQTAQQHQSAPKRHAHEADDDTLQSFGDLSPHSLFYHEYVKRQALPEPVSSRINDVMEATTTQAAASRHPMSFTSVAATLIRAVHDKYTGDPDGVATAANGQQVQFSSIQVLDLSDNCLTDAAILPLLQSLEAAPSWIAIRKGSGLCRLNLSHNAIGVRGGDEALAPLTTAIECHPSLQVVNLSYNNIGEKGGALLGDMITQPSWTAVAFAYFLRRNASLETLRLQDNSLGAVGTRVLLQAVGCGSRCEFQLS
ncbi:hypothetical protein PybrP1_003890, partial [[Pythium] brassicae (nom. inval.)]